MALTRPILQAWLVGCCQNHMKQCGWSLEKVANNPDLNDPLWDGLQRFGLQPADPTNIQDTDFASITPAQELPFKVLCRIELKRKVLEHYLSQVTQGVIQTRVEFDKRARLLKEDLENEELAYRDILARTNPDGAYGNRISDRTNIPDAVCIPYHP